MEDVMQEKVKRFRWVAIVGLALLVVPMAQARNDSQVLAADGIQQEVAAQAYSQQLAAGNIAQLRAMKKVSQSTPGSYPAGTTFPNGTTSYPFSASKASGETDAAPAPISENSPVEQRLNPSPPVTATSSGSGFDYGDAGIGAGIAALLTSMLALGAGSAISRKRVAHG
jgi:hypothetical protein